MILKSDVFVIKKILHKTKAKFFMDLKVGDSIEIEMEVEHKGQSSGGGAYATFMTIRNVGSGISTVNSQSQLVNNLGNFEIEELEIKF